jgi:hypothetical protein
VHDGGKLTGLPSVVQRKMTAFPTTPDLGTDAERWGGTGEGSYRALQEQNRRVEVGRLDLSMVLLGFCLCFWHALLSP